MARAYRTTPPLAAFTHSSGNSYTIINPVRYDADDGLPRPCPPMGMIHRYRRVRHDLSRLTIIRALSTVIQ